MNSDFDANKILYNAQTDEESSLLRKKKICVSDKAVKFFKKDRTNFTCSSSDFIEERKVIQKQLSAGVTMDIFTNRILVMFGLGVVVQLI